MIFLPKPTECVTKEATNKVHYFIGPLKLDFKKYIKINEWLGVVN